MPKPQQLSTPKSLSNTEINALRGNIEKQLLARANPERREVLTGGYTPTRMTCVGVSVPDMRAVVRAMSKQLKDMPALDMLRLARALVDARVMEARHVAYELIGGREDVLELLDANAIQRLGAGNDNWATVDTFAMFVAGRAWGMGRVTDADVRSWAKSPDKWWRRTALASTVNLNLKARGGRGDSRRTLMIAGLFAAEHDPMLAKALSWALRSLAPHDPAGVRDFLEEHSDTLPPVVVREVQTKITTGKKQR